LASELYKKDATHHREDHRSLERMPSKFSIKTMAIQPLISELFKEMQMLTHHQHVYKNNLATQQIISNM